MQLLQELGKAYLALAQYDCHASLELFSAVSPQQYNTGWVLTQIGRAHFELSDYQKVRFLLVFTATLRSVVIITWSFANAVG